MIENQSIDLFIKEKELFLNSIFPEASISINEDRLIIEASYVDWNIIANLVDIKHANLIQKIYNPKLFICGQSVSLKLNKEIEYKRTKKIVYSLRAKLNQIINDDIICEYQRLTKPIKKDDVKTIEEISVEVKPIKKDPVTGNYLYVKFDYSYEIRDVFYQENIEQDVYFVVKLNESFDIALINNGWKDIDFSPLKKDLFDKACIFLKSCGNSNKIIYKKKFITDKNPYLIGRVCQHCDGDGHHKFIPLKIENDICKGLMVTSNPNWANKVRKISNEEKVFLSLVREKYNSYFALTTVAKSDLFLTNKSFFTQDRINDLIKEFIPNNEGL